MIIKSPDALPGPGARGRLSNLAPSPLAWSRWSRIGIAFAMLSVWLVTSQSRPLYGQSFRLDPELVIGSADTPETAFSDIQHIAVGDDGSLFVAERLTDEIKVFDAAGEPTAILGGRGGGPGEFTGLERLGWLGRSLWAVDRTSQTITLFELPSGRANTIGFRGPVHPPGARPLRPLAFFPDSSVLGIPTIAADQWASGEISATPVLRYSLDARTFTVLDSLDRRNGLVRILLGGRRLYQFEQPINYNSLWDVSADGEALVIVHMEEPQDNDRGSFRVIKIGRGGFEKAYRYTPRRLEEGVIERFTSGQARVLSRLGYSQRQAMEVARDSLRLPRYTPPVTEVVAGRDGTIWLRRAEPDRTSTVDWLLLDSGGTIRGTVVAPKRLRVMEATQSTAWGVQLDQMDVAYVVRARVRAVQP